MNYRHWDHYVETIAHPFVAEVTANGISKNDVDIIEGEPYESPLAPFGGIEQFDWSKDSKQIAYTCRKKERCEICSINRCRHISLQYRHKENSEFM